jgi:hypothetical protein
MAEIRLRAYRRVGEISGELEATEFVPGKGLSSACQHAMDVALYRLVQVASAGRQR